MIDVRNAVEALPPRSFERAASPDVVWAVVFGAELARLRGDAHRMFGAATTEDDLDAAAIEATKVADEAVAALLRRRVTT